MAWQARLAARIIEFGMGEIREAEPAKLIVGMLSAYAGAFAEAESRLTQVLGEVDLRSDLFAHEFTEYYRDEMGHPLLRYFISFADLIPPDRLPMIKRLANQIEQDVAATGEWAVPAMPKAPVPTPKAAVPTKTRVVRPVNLDPGYITPSKLVLASTKDWAHRIYLGHSIWAEVTLRFRGSRWTELEWTYPDYRSREYHEFFTRVRDRLKAQRQGDE